LNRRLDAGAVAESSRGAAAVFAVIAFVAAVSAATTAVAAVVFAGQIVRIVSALAEVLRLDIADVQKAVSADTEVDERGLNAWLQVDDLSRIDVADVIVLAGALDIELFKDAVFNDRDAAFFRLAHVDQHFFFHGFAFLGRCEGDP
jgi:hypothetical protein